MNKNRIILTLCSMLFLYSCNVNTPNNKFKNAKLQEQAVTLTNDEQHKFNLLMNKIDQSFKAHTFLSKKSNSNAIEKYQKFRNWILNDIKKQKELSNSFSKAYHSFKNTRQAFPTNNAIEQHVNNALNLHQNSGYSNNTYEISQYDDINHNNIIEIFEDNNTNEKIFQRLKEEFQYDYRITFRWKN
ncbi:hypothetical protein [Borrelia crocidurae]|uniref:ORFk-like protein n=1 Tax=Borrelia crocidurae (strain Achema) TaxID=1155096 RepID=I0FF29_BORCA|nr:hypothetical protein [Borrelia crocidurae]AFI32085.1 ORFk-like protein [Borrelia crocidurae str. Achema]